MYNIYIENIDGSYNSNYGILNDITFTNILWSWQWYLVADIEVVSTSLAWKIVKVWIWDKIIYSWYVEEHLYLFNKISRLRCVWLYWLFTRFETSKNYYVDNAYINNLKSKIDSSFPWLVNWVELSSENYDYSVSWYSNYNSIIEGIISESWKEFFFWADRVIKYKENISTTTHLLTVWEEVYVDWSYISKSMIGYLSRTEISSEDYSSWEIINSEDELLYWVSEHYEDSTWNITKKAVESLSSPKDKTVLKVDTNWDYNVWDKVTLSWSDVIIEDVKILKITYWVNTSILYLDSYDSIYNNLK